jgi:hypothetical protein
MAKYRKRPVVIEATQFVHDHSGHGNHEAIGELVDGWKDADTPFIKTLEGELTVSNGDWIITGIAGERYPCKPDIFAATYEPVEEV